MNPQNKTTPKDFFLWAGAMVSLYWSVVAFISLFFNYIDRAFPDPLTLSYVDFSSGSVRFEMASLIVLVPIFFVLMYFIRRSIIVDATRAEVWVRRWALYLTLFVSGLMIVGTLIFLINDFLSIDVTRAFLYKTLLIIAVASIGFMHFLADVWGYWQQHPDYARNIAVGIVVLVIATIASGFMIFGTPQQARMYRYDDQKVTDLYNIQQQIIEYWQRESKLPDQLNVLNDDTAGYTVPTDPQSKILYEYKIIDKNTIQICANFNNPTQEGQSQPMMYTPYGDSSSDSWYHGMGRTCFTRTIDPKRYPPNSPKVPAVKQP